MNILHICANPKPVGESVSRQLAEAFFAKLAELNSGAEVTTVNLFETPPPFYTYETFRNFWYPVFVTGYAPTEEEQAAAAYARAQGELFNKADVLVLTTPMWNFTVPGILKAWMDQVLAPNQVFTIGPGGAKPLHHIRRIVLLVASGGSYREGDPRDALLPQVQSAFGFVGISNVSVAWADGQNPFFFKDCDARKATALEAARDLAEEIAEGDL